MVMLLAARQRSRSAQALQLPDGAGALRAFASHQGLGHWWLSSSSQASAAARTASSVSDAQAYSKSWSAVGLPISPSASTACSRRSASSS